MSEIGNALEESGATMGVFSEEWMHAYARLWNAEQTMVRELTRQRFNAVVGYGFLDQPTPRGLLVVVRGVAEQAGQYDGRELDWDLRAGLTDWLEWLEQGFDLPRLLVLVGTQRLQLWKGDHKRILRRPPLVNALLRAFALMPEVRA